MPICHETQLIFVHVPKTAGTSFEKAIGICGVDNHGSNAFSSTLLFGHDGKCFIQHLTAPEICERVGLPTYTSYFKFAIVRNPFARVVSAYLGSHYRDTRFDKFVQRILPRELKSRLEHDFHRHFKPQFAFAFDEMGRPMVDLVARQEHLTVGLAELARRSSVNVQLSRKCETKGSSYRDYFSDRTRRLVESYYAEDLEVFGYDFEGQRDATRTFYDAESLERITC